MVLNFGLTLIEIKLLCRASKKVFALSDHFIFVIVIIVLTLIDAKALNSAFISDHFLFVTLKFGETILD